MALFGSARDVSLFRTLSRELVNEIIDIEVDIFKAAVYDSETNLYYILHIENLVRMKIIFYWNIN